VIRRFEVDVEAAPSGRTNAYLLGDGSLLIDPATPVHELDLDPARIDHVAVTHTHPDHVGGLRSIRERTDATVWAHGSYTKRFLRHTGVEPDRTFGEGTVVADTGVSVRWTPGHSPDHVVFEDETGAVVGDLARASGSVMVGVPDGDMRAYLTSLRRLLVGDVETAYPGHGPPIEDPTGRFARVIAHRLDRERAVETAVKNGAREVSEIVDAAYEKDLAGNRDLAARTVIAHLEKLSVEDRVSWDGSVAHRS
jgi:glyoxylase-like metal-dependent hydrolase (beta-lactamase superfamily II)